MTTNVNLQDKCKEAILNYYVIFQNFYTGTEENYKTLLKLKRPSKL